jgi:transcriptional regulator GlxA family with amidase domain
MPVTSRHPRAADARRIQPALFTLPALRRARDLIDRDFAAAYGETPRAYLARRRIERATDLLRVANLSVTEICFLVGLESLGSFSSL